MCGITGYMALRGSPAPDAGVIERMTASLAHRGPDDAGIYQDGPIALGHRRLSIIDLSPLGRQPMTAPGLSTWIVFNGEVYNFEEIRRDLEAEGRRFVSRTDTEVVLQAYDRWGPDFLERVNGMFALVIYEPTERRFFIARDRLGVKPLYTLTTDRHFAFASELKALLRFPGFSREIDQDALLHYFAYKYVRAPRSIFKGVRKLLPGHWAYVNQDGGVHDQCYWDPVAVASNRKKTSGGEGVLLDELEDLLRQATKYRLISDVPLGALLSGGVDSTLIVAVMKQLHERVKTFTIGFADPEFDEAPAARAVAGFLGTDHTELYVDAATVFQHIPSLVERFDEPFADPSALPTMLVAELAGRTVTVALSGDGGDEMFWGYSRYVKYARAAAIRGIPAAARRGVFGLLAMTPHDRVQKMSHGLSYRTPEECYEYLNGIFKDADLQRLLQGSGVERPGLFTDRRVLKLDLHDRPALADIQSYLPDDVLTKVDRTSMGVPLEVRSPLLDYRVAEFALHLPWQLKYRGGNQKYLLRKVLGRHLPPGLVGRKKKGFDLPLNRWFRKELREMVMDHLSESRVRRSGLLNVGFVRRVLEMHMSGRYDYYYMLWSLLIFDLWYDRFISGDR